MSDTPSRIPSMSKILSRSSRLQSPRFAGVVDRHISSNEKILNAADGDIEASFGGSPTRLWDLAIVLTDQKLWGFRPNGRLGGAKNPECLNLKEVTKVAVTRQNNVAIEFTDSYGIFRSWKLRLGGHEPTADLWMTVILEACKAIHKASESQREGVLSAELDRLRREQE
jgi:hypothetical protein